MRADSNNVHEAKTRFSRLLAREGEEIIIAKAGKPIDRIVPKGDIHLTQVKLS